MSRKRNYDDWLQGFVEYTSYGEAPVSMCFWTGVCTIAGALRRRVWIDQAYFQWLPNFYIILVAPPGIVSKTTTAAAGMDLLRLVPGVKFGPDIATWQALSMSFAGALEYVEMPDGLQHGMSCLTLSSGELGNLLNPHDREMVDFLVTLWDGKKGSIEKMTKTQGEDKIENPCINMIACTTPAWIEGNVPEYMIGGGFTSRCIFVFADKKRQYVAYPHLAVPKDFKIRQAKLVDDLIEMADLKGEFRLLPETIEWGTEWYREHYENQPALLKNARFGGYIARKQTHIHKLAMVLSVAKRSSLEITRHDLETANTIITSLEKDMPAVFEGIGTSPAARGASTIVTAISAQPGITKQALFSRLFKELSFNDFENGLRGAMESGRVEIRQVGSEFVFYPKG